jgi:hypothetical protein
LGLFPQIIAQRAPHDGERQRDMDVRPLNADIAHHPKLDHVAAQFRIDYLGKRLLDLLVRWHILLNLIKI